ncbi:MAG: GNAT family N-acetyltransferase [Bacteroidetes bacterium]|nr:GNAT family N-acetyltransferase [Bacteroidota bacterium]
MMPERLESERLVLQRLTHEDASEIFYTYASKEEATRYVSWPTHQTMRDTNDFLRYAVAAWKKGTDFSWSVRLKETGRLVGSIGVLPGDGKVQFGYAFGPAHWNKGYATEVVKRVLLEVKKMDGVYRIGTLVDVENVASAKVLLKCGLIEEARLEKWMRFPNQNNQPKDCILFKLPQ